MKLDYCVVKEGNFGDDLNPWMWPRLIGECLDPDDGTLFVGIGTLLDQWRVENRELGQARKVVVFGAGCGSDTPPILNDKWHIYCVRGPRTAELMGLAPEMAVVDSAYLIRTFDPLPASGEYPFAFMPHHRSEDYVDWQAVCDQAGIKFISPRLSVDQVLADMGGTKVLLTEAMHGAIVADALRVPWVPVTFSPKFAFAKWQDFTRSIDVEPDYGTLTGACQFGARLGKRIEGRVKQGLSAFGLGKHKWQDAPPVVKGIGNAALDILAEDIQGIVEQSHPVLSSDTRAEELTEELQARLELLRSDFHKGLLVAS